MKAVNVYQSSDGQKFDTRAAAEAHERGLDAVLLGFAPERIEAAVSGDDRPLGQAVERWARRIAQGRIERGDYKRRAIKPADAPPDDAKALEPKDGTAAP